jgi:hypothetical protein
MLVGRDPCPHGGLLLPEVDRQRILLGRGAAFLPRGPLVHLIATTDDAELANRVEALRIARW